MYIIEREHNNLAMESKTTANNNNSTMPEGMGCRVPYLFSPFLVRLQHLLYGCFSMARTSTFIKISSL
jgi:hypothetical protein